MLYKLWWNNWKSKKMSCTLYKAGWHWTHSRLVLLCVRNRLHLQARVKKEITEGHNCITVDTTSKQIISYTQTHHKPTRHARKEKECPFNVRHWVTKTDACLGGNHVCRLWIQIWTSLLYQEFLLSKASTPVAIIPSQFEIWMVLCSAKFFLRLDIYKNKPSTSIKMTRCAKNKRHLIDPSFPAPGPGCQSCLSLPGAEEGDAQEWDAEDVLSCNEMNCVAVRCTVMQWDALWYNMRCTELQWDADAGDAKIVHPDFGLCIPALHTAAHPPRPPSVFIIPLHAFFGSTNTVHYRLSP